jgi:uncharacterized coiled-coil protein SlyX
MGLFWDLIQESKISEQGKRAESLEARVAQLEKDLDQMRRIFGETLRRLEKHVNSDLDGDGGIG